MLRCSIPVSDRRHYAWVTLMAVWPVLLTMSIPFCVLNLNGLLSLCACASSYVIKEVTYALQLAKATSTISRVFTSVRQ